MRLEEIIGSCSPWDGYIFDPLSYIRAVNYLRAEEKSMIIADLRSYIQPLSKRLVPESTSVFFLLRLLFEPVDPGVRLPVPGVGGPMDTGPVVAEDFPLYPLVLINDVPLLIVPGFFLGGLPEDPSRHIEFVERHCRVRPLSLVPPDNPLSLADDLLSSEIWYRPASEDDKAILRAQLLRLVRDAYPVHGVFEDIFYGKLMEEGVWKRYEEIFASLSIVWDQNENNYRLLT